MHILVRRLSLAALCHYVSLTAECFFFLSKGAIWIDSCGRLVRPMCGHIKCFCCSPSGPSHIHTWLGWRLTLKIAIYDVASVNTPGFKTAPASQDNLAAVWKVKDTHFAPERLSSLSPLCVAINPFLSPVCRPSIPPPRLPSSLAALNSPNRRRKYELALSHLVLLIKGFWGV